MANKIPYHIPDDPRLKTVKRISKLMDEEFSIGGFKFGLDPILNLIPIAGDAGTYIVSIGLILTMLKHGVSGKVAMKMIGNATLDAVVGAIPIIGWIFDFAYKANTRNTKLLAEYYTEGKHTGSGKGYVILIALIFLAIIITISIFAFYLIRFLAREIDTTLGLPA